MWVTDKDNDGVGCNLTEQESTKSSSARRKSDLLLRSGDEENGMGTCTICLCNYENGEQICWSNNPSCYHHFHSTCGVAWLAKHSECPVCRAEYLVDPVTSNDTDEEATKSTVTGGSSDEADAQRTAGDDNV